MEKAERTLKKVEVTPTDPAVERQWNIIDDEGLVHLVKKRFKIKTPPPPRQKTTRALLGEILAKLS